MSDTPPPGKREPPAVPVAERTSPWVQLRFFSFHPAVFPRMLGEVSPDARPGDFVSVYDKVGRLCGAGLFNPRAKMPSGSSATARPKSTSPISSRRSDAR